MSESAGQQFRSLDSGKITRTIERTPMGAFELSRYLDYCSELLSLTGKVAALSSRTSTTRWRCRRSTRSRG